MVDQHRAEQGDAHDLRHHAQEIAHDPRHPEHRQERGDGRQIGGDDRHPHFIDSDLGGRNRVLASLDVAMDVLGHDDRAIDHHAEDENEAEDDHVRDRNPRASTETTSATAALKGIAISTSIEIRRPIDHARMTRTSIAPKSALLPKHAKHDRISSDVSRVVENVMKGYVCFSSSTFALTASAAPSVLMSASLLTMIVAHFFPSSSATLMPRRCESITSATSSHTDRAPPSLETIASRMSSHAAKLRLRSEPAGQTAPCWCDPAGISAWKSTIAWRTVADRQAVLGHQVGIDVDVDLAFLPAVELRIGDAVDRLEFLLDVLGDLLERAVVVAWRPGERHQHQRLALEVDVDDDRLHLTTRPEVRGRIRSTRSLTSRLASSGSTPSRKMTIVTEDPRRLVDAMKSTRLRSVNTSSTFLAISSSASSGAASG